MDVWKQINVMSVRSVFTNLNPRTPLLTLLIIDLKSIERTAGRKKTKEE